MASSFQDDGRPRWNCERILFLFVGSFLALPYHDVAADNHFSIPRLATMLAIDYSWTLEVREPIFMTTIIHLLVGVVFHLRFTEYQIE